MTVARRTPGPAYANLQGRKPRDVGRGGASDAMGILAQAACCRCALNACLGSDQGGNEAVRLIAIGRTVVARRGLIDRAIVDGGATASMVIAGREPTQQKCRTGMSQRIQSDHDVSILITAGAGVGRVRGEAPRWNLSMTIMRPPQHGPGCKSGLGSAASAQRLFPASG